MRKRYLSILVACTMLFTSVPTAAFAEEAAPVDAAAVEAVAVEEEAAPAADDSMTAEVAEPVEQAQQDAEASDEAAVYPVDELFDAEVEQSEEDVLAPEIAGEADEAFADGSGLIEDIEVVEENSIAEVIETAADTEGTLSLNKAQNITLNASNDYTATFEVAPGSYLMHITSYVDDGDGVMYAVSPETYTDSFYYDSIREINCSETNGTITFKNENKEDGGSEFGDISFTVTLKKAPSASDAKELVLNESDTISLGTGEYGVYKFSPSATGRYTMYIDGQDISSALITVYDEDSFDNDYYYQDWASVTCSLTADKTYYYLVRGYNYEYLGNCTITLQEAPGASDAKALVLNGSDTIELKAGEYRVYSFSPSVTGRYTMYMDGESKSSVLITVYEDSFDYDYYYGYNGSVTCSLTAGKTYYYLVKGEDYQQVSACTMHFIQTPAIIGATLAAVPSKREYVKGTGSYITLKGMKVTLTYSNGSSKVIECGEDEYDEEYDDYDNEIDFQAYNKDINGNTDYATSIGYVDSDYPSGVYDMGAEVYTYTGSRYVLVTRVTVPFTIVDKGQHIHIWGAWTNTATGQTRKCELCGAAETKNNPVLELTASKLTMKKGQSTNKFKVTKMNAGDSLVSVKSSDKKVLKVSNVKANGTFKLKALKVTGKKKVKLTITLASGLSKTVTVTIQNAKVKTTKVKTDKKLTLKAKKKAKLKSVITPVTSQDKVKYKSSNTKVATVNAKGVVTAKKPGKAKITIQSGSKRATCTVTVQKK